MASSVLLLTGLLVICAAEEAGSVGGQEGEQLECGYLNTRECDPATKPCPFTQTCVPEELGNGHGRLGCFAVWRNTSKGGVQILSKGCWFTHSLDPCGDEEKCVASGAQSGDGIGNTYYCCCHRSNCNDILRLELTTTTAPPLEVTSPIARSSDAFWAVIYAFIPVCILAMVILIGYVFYRRCSLRRHADRRKVTASGASASSASPSAKAPYNPEAPMSPIQLQELKARGRFGCVWKALQGDRVVAVKVFPPQDVDSWMQEQEIYSVPGMRHHPNILQYLGAECRSGGKEFWIVTAFQDRGSLFDFLKMRTVSVREALHIAAGALRGLTFLHEEILAPSAYKPSIVHRDVKSRNVLLRSDLTACLADFGLALKCEHGRTPNDTHGQVGTRRYMAPEVLEGATEFSAFAFRQIDVYAMALVMWEVVSRCRVVNETVSEYKLPFEEEVGQHPSLQEMQETVVAKKQRPMLKPLWRHHPQLGAVAQTIEEMWDAEPEARITTGCALERLVTLTSTLDPPPPYLPLPEAPESAPLISQLEKTA